jgi:ribosome maturation factor RimP
MAGLMPMPGYAGVFLVAAVSSDSGLVETLSSVDLDDSESVANAVSDLLRWRKRVMEYRLDVCGPGMTWNRASP